MQVENAEALARVVDYIHLNPVRAKVIPAEQLAGYRWSSLRRLIKGPRPACMGAEVWLGVRGGWKDNAEGLAH